MAELAACLQSEAVNVVAFSDYFQPGVNIDSKSEREYQLFCYGIFNIIVMDLHAEK